MYVCEGDPCVHGEGPALDLLFRLVVVVCVLVRDNAGGRLWVSSICYPGGVPLCRAAPP